MSDVRTRPPIARFLPVATFVLLLVASLAATGCGGGGGGAEVPTGGPIVLVTIDTLRSDRLPVYGYDRVETPAIDAFRADGILYEHAYSPVPMTLPAHSSIFTGLLPPATGVRDNAGYRLSEDAGPTVAERLGAAGYATGGAISAFVLRRETGVARGFDHWDDAIQDSPRKLMGDLQRSGEETLKAALSWLDTVEDRPVFLFFHIYEPHIPRDPPEPFKSRYADKYDGEVAAADAVMEKLFSALRERGLYDRSTIVLLSDHGEGLGDHGEDEHGILLYRESLQVPLLVKLPGQRLAGATVSTPVELTDVAPTLYQVAGVDAPEGLPGTSLLRFAGSEPVPAELAHRPLYSETFHANLRFGWSGLRSVIEDGHHYIEGVDRELYDLAEDPAERHNLVREDRRTYATLRDALATFPTELQQPFEESTETRQALAALGYLGSSAASHEGPPVDPKTRIGDLRVLQRGISQVMDQDPAAVDTLRHAVELLPGTIDGWQFLGLALQKTGHPAEALEAYQKAFELSHGAPHLAKPMAYLALQLQRWDDAIAYVSLAIDNDPDNLDLKLVQTRAMLFAGKLNEALETVETVVAAEPDNAEAHYLLGGVYMGRKQLEPAENELRRALALDPQHRGALSDLAVLLMSQGRRDEARPLIERLQTMAAAAPAGGGARPSTR